MSVSLAIVKKGKSKKGLKRTNKSGAKDIAASYNQPKHFKGLQYTGMHVGRSHKWHYDEGEWIETKITPQLWEISYDVTKRRVGHAPKGSGVPVGTGYHWYILAHQVVKKLNANDYTTEMNGLKLKLSHKRADKQSWSASPANQRKQLIKFLKEMITELDHKTVPLLFEYNNKKWKGEAVPIPRTCENGICHVLDVILNGEPVGIIHRARTGWKIKHVEDQKFIDAIGEQIAQWYE
jgi:hypothetical protein